MTNKQPQKCCVVEAVHVHPFFFHTVYGPKQRRQHITRQLSRLVAILIYGAGFVQFASMAGQIPFLAHLPVLWGFLAAIIGFAVAIAKGRAGRSKFKQYENLKKTSVVYTRSKNEVR